MKRINRPGKVEKLSVRKEKLTIFVGATIESRFLLLYNSKRVVLCHFMAWNAKFRCRAAAKWRFRNAAYPADEGKELAKRMRQEGQCRARI